MKLILLFLIALVFSCNPISNSEFEEVKKASLAQAEEFQNSLQKELKQAIETSGVEGAIDKCKVSSPLLEKEFSDKYKISLKRVSDLYRNPNHKPDDWEHKTLEEFQSFLKKGEEPPVISFKEGNTIRIMKPIVIKNPLCLQCHGESSSISPTALDSIKKNYPADKAIGYKMNDLRGAFSITWIKR